MRIFSFKPILARAWANEFICTTCRSSPIFSTIIKLSTYLSIFRFALCCQPIYLKLLCCVMMFPFSRIFLNLGSPFLTVSNPLFTCFYLLLKRLLLALKFLELCTVIFVQIFNSFILAIQAISQDLNFLFEVSNHFLIIVSYIFHTFCLLTMTFLQLWLRFL